MITIVVTSIICFTVILAVGMWKADRTEQRVLVRELSTQATPDQRDMIRKQAGLS